MTSSRFAKYLARGAVVLGISCCATACTSQRTPDLTAVVLPASVASAFSSLSGRQLQDVLASDILFDFQEEEPVTVLVFTDCVDLDHLITKRCNLKTAPGEIAIEADLLEEHDLDDDLGCGEGLILECGTFTPGPGTSRFSFHTGLVELSTPSATHARDVVIDSW